MGSLIPHLTAIAKSMDIILLGSNDLIGRLICYAQKVQTLDGKPSLWSHCALYVEEDEILESTIDFEKHETGRRLDNGVQYNDIFKLDKYDRVMLVQLPLTDLQREILLRRAEHYYNTRTTYSISGLLGSLLSYWIFRWQSNPLQTKHALYCSAFVAAVYEAIGIDFDPYHTARNTSPEMISQYTCPGVRKIPIKLGGHHV